MSMRKVIEVARADLGNTEDHDGSDLTEYRCGTYGIDAVHILTPKIRRNGKKKTIWAKDKAILDVMGGRL